MLRLCSESSRPYPGRSARHAVRMCFIPSGESAGWGDRLTKSRRFKVSFHLETSETRKQAGWERKIREEPRLVGQLTG